MGEFSLCLTIPHTTYFLKNVGESRRYILFMSGQALPSGLRKTMKYLSGSLQVSKNFEREFQTSKPIVCYKTTENQSI